MIEGCHLSFPKRFANLGNESLKWVVRFTETANGHFELEHEEGKFE